MPRQQIVDEIADNRVWFISKLGHDATDKSSAAAVPFQIDRTMEITPALDLCPTVRTAGLFGPHFDEIKFLLQ